MQCLQLPLNPIHVSMRNPQAAFFSSCLQGPTDLAKRLTNYLLQCISPVRPLG